MKVLNDYFLQTLNFFNNSITKLFQFGWNGGPEKSAYFILFYLILFIYLLSFLLEVTGASIGI